jgi:hypothetical protein
MRPALLAALLAASLPTGGCKTVDRADGASQDPEDRCRREFAACAPPARYGPETRVEALELRKLVHVASRIDLGGLSASAAKRLVKIATEGDAAVLLELESALEDADNLLGRCRCKEIVPEIEKKRVREIVASRVPSRELRSPDTWTARIAVRLAAMREQTRMSALLAIAPDAGAPREADAHALEAERELCETVHAARGMLAPEAFAGMLEAVVRRREDEAGAGSADSARRTLAEYARSESCEDAGR